MSLKAQHSGEAMAKWFLGHLPGREILNTGQMMVLLVDDDVAFTCGAARYLQGRGMPTVVVSGSTAAFDFLERNEVPSW